MACCHSVASRRRREWFSRIKSLIDCPHIRTTTAVPPRPSPGFRAACPPGNARKVRSAWLDALVLPGQSRTRGTSRAGARSVDPTPRTIERRGLARSPVLNETVRGGRCGGTADAEDLKSSGGEPPCGFDSHRRQSSRTRVDGPPSSRPISRGPRPARRPAIAGSDRSGPHCGRDLPVRRRSATSPCAPSGGGDDGLGREPHYIARMRSRCSSRVPTGTRTTDSMVEIDRRVAVARDLSAGLISWSPPPRSRVGRVTPRRPRPGGRARGG